MKDFPFFTTENGAASLTLKEIPYKQIAYIKILDSLSPDLLLEECVSFCRMCGAETILASGHSYLENYPLHTKILQMCGNVEASEIACLFPVTSETVSKWRTIYNEKMRNVPNAATLEAKEEAYILEAPGAYFIHEDGQMLGIGWMEDTKLLAVASCKKGSGKRIMASLQSLIGDDQMLLEVADSNQKAVSLYQALGFLTIGEKSWWYQVFPKV